MGAIHIPTATPNDKSEQTGYAKTRFWDAVLHAATERIAEPFMFIGDLNTGLRTIDELGSTFYCSEHFGRMPTSGWGDAWRHFHGTRFEPTWLGRTRNGFRIDHAFVSPGLLPRLRACRYEHGVREMGISDHSMLVVQID